MIAGSGKATPEQKAAIVDKRGTWIGPDSATYLRDSDMAVQAALKARIAALEALIVAHNAKCRARCEACGNYPACDGLCPRNYIIEASA